MDLEFCQFLNSDICFLGGAREKGNNCTLSIKKNFFCYLIFYLDIMINPLFAKKYNFLKIKKNLFAKKIYIQ